MPVPYFDLSRAVRRIEPLLAERWRRVVDGTLCLPCHPELTDAELDEVCRAVRAFYGG